MLNRLPATRIRLTVAAVLYRALKLARLSDRQRVVRDGITFDVDISEALGLSLFLLGGFQKHVVNPRLIQLPEDAVIVDVGANIGALTLRFAQLAPRGRVYAFEPTDDAYAALCRNLALNPALSPRVDAIKAFLSDAPREAVATRAYASWRVSGLRPPRDAHTVHGGSLMTATATPTLTLDAFYRERGLQRLDYVKIDTDGHELEVLRGSAQTLRRLHPTVVFEVGSYLVRERGHSMAEYFDLFEPLGYRLRNAKNGHPVSRRDWEREIPRLATTDLIATWDDAAALAA